MKKVLRWMGIAVVSPILLFVILAALLYLPPVQNWAVQKVAAVVSEKTDMEVSIQHVNLEWPLDLGIDGLRMLHRNDTLPQVKDTIADIRHLTADVQLWPLLESKVIINELAFREAKVNTNGFISDVRIKGDLEELWLASRGIDLDKQTVEVNGARLNGARIDLNLTDTAAVDTSKSKTRWLIAADSLTLHESALKLHLPGDTLNIAVYFGQTVARETNIDLATGIYRVGSLDWREGTAHYDNRWEPFLKGFDYNHIGFSDIDLRVDSFSYSPQGLALTFRRCAMKERCGIELTQLNGALLLDSTYNNLKLPAAILRTPETDIKARLDLDFNAFSETNAGWMTLEVDANVGKQDLISFLGEMPQAFTDHFPNRPLHLAGTLDGNMPQLRFTGVEVSMPTNFQATVDGTADYLSNPSRRKANLKVSAKAEDADFLLAMADPTLLNDYRLPGGITLDATLRADGSHYEADLDAREGRGTIGLKFKADDGTLPGYEIEARVDSLNLHHFMPKDSLYTLSADLTAKGRGLDFLNPHSHLEAKTTVRHLAYGQLALKGLTAEALLADGRGQASVSGQNELLNGTIGIDALLNTERLDGTLTANVTHADLLKLRLVSDTLAVGLSGRFDLASDLKQRHRISGRLSDLLIRDEKRTFRPKDIGLLLNTTPDTTYLRAQSGDFIVKLDGSGGYQRLISQVTQLSDSLLAQYEQRIIDQPAIKRLLPTMKLHVESRRDNPVADLLHTSDITFGELLLDVATSPETGINGQSRIYALNYDSIRIDTIRLALTQKGDRLTYQGQVRNNRRNPQFVFNALVDGHFHQHGALAGVRVFDTHNKLGLRVGATAEMEADGMRFRLMPERPVLGYKEFTLNKDNYVFLDKRQKIQAKIDLIANDKTGVKVYSENQDSTMLQDLTVSINRLDLGEVTSVIPYAPRITGHLNGDFHILQDQRGNFSVASDMGVRDMTYERSPIGNLSTEFVYLMKDDNEDQTVDAHAIEARMMLDDEEIGVLNGTYHANDSIDAKFTMAHFPLSIANGFVPDQIVGLEGFGEGGLTIHGTTTHPKVNGEVFVEDAYLVSNPYSIRMRFDNDPLRIVDSHLLLENFGLYANNEEPLNIMGDVDFSNTDRITMDMRMRARNLLLIDAKQQLKSVAFGKAFVNIFARLQGPLEALSMRGRLDVLGSTDMTYMLLDSPLSSDNRLDELVKFTDFSDTTQTVVTRPMPTGFTMDLNVSVSQGARIVCDLNAERTNYVDLMGGGDLRLKYNTEGLGLTGRYTLNNGEMKYSLPVIPLKTFTIKNGSYVEFTGDPSNPKLNITATERTKASVTSQGGGTRSVTFDCGVIITKTLSDMGLEFTIEAPEDNSISGELATLSVEERGKTAVAMLTTGMYLTGANSNFSMNSALGNFLQSEINTIAGSALKTLDVSVGIDNTTDASGTMHTDYSFKFAKRFLNNRLKIQLGGKFSSNANAAMGQAQSFFDNVTAEYRLNQDATQNVKLYYFQNVYDWLDGYTGEYGVGFVWRRKLDSFIDILRFWKKEEDPLMPRRDLQRPVGSDRKREDSDKEKENADKENNDKEKENNNKEKENDQK